MIKHEQTPIDIRLHVYELFLNPIIQSVMNFPAPDKAGEYRGCEALYECKSGLQVHLSAMLPIF